MTEYAELDNYLNNEFSNKVTPINTGWDYQPIKAGLKPVDDFNSEILPDAFQSFVEDASNRMQSPPDFIAVGLMVALSSIAGRKVAIHPKQYDNWLIVPNLWGAIIGRPSTLKSPSLNEALKPIVRLEVEAGKVHKQGIAEYASDERLQKMILQMLMAKQGRRLRTATQRVQRRCLEWQIMMSLRNPLDSVTR